EAQAQDGNVRVDRFLHQPLLSPDELVGVVVCGELRAQRDDDVVVGGIEPGLLQVDAEHLDLRAVLLEPLRHVARRRGVLVLEDQRAQARPVRAGLLAHPAAPEAAGAASSPSTSAATSRTASANRDTISARSSSGVVNGGANRVWSPA